MPMGSSSPLSFALGIEKMQMNCSATGRKRSRTPRPLTLILDPRGFSPFGKRSPRMSQEKRVSVDVGVQERCAWKPSRLRYHAEIVRSGPCAAPAPPRHYGSSELLHRAAHAIHVTPIHVHPILREERLSLPVHQSHLLRRPSMHGLPHEPVGRAVAAAVG